MCMCTYLGDSQHTAPTTDAELNSLLADVRSVTGDDWRIGENITERPRLFRKPIITKRYTLYSQVSGIEFQIINFYRPDRADEWLPSINASNDAGYVAAYLYGILAVASSMPTAPTAQKL